MFNKVLISVFLLISVANAIIAQATRDLALAENKPVENKNVNTGLSDVNVKTTSKYKFTLDAYGEITSPELAFEEEYFLGGDLTKKWNAFQNSYRREYEQTVGFSNSSVEIIKPTIYNAVNKINNYFKKAVRKGQVGKESARQVMTHVLDCANLLYLEPDTQEIEGEIKKAKSVENMVDVFAVIRINYHHM
jgi:hypothetical protein